MTGLFVAVAGALAGGAHVWGLARAAGAGPCSVLLRLSLVAVVLVLAARAGHVLLGASTWAAVFVIGAVVHARRRR